MGKSWNHASDIISFPRSKIDFEFCTYGVLNDF